MWPAMWPGYPNPGSSFFDDDPENQKTADEYGIVMSTSHHEPMQRATNEWFDKNEKGTWSWITNKEKITQFFDEGIERGLPYESYYTMGMRGEYDRAMNTDDPAGVVQDVINTQRALIASRTGHADSVPRKPILTLTDIVLGYRLTNYLSRTSRAFGPLQGSTGVLRCWKACGSRRCDASFRG